MSFNKLPEALLDEIVGHAIQYMDKYSARCALASLCLVSSSMLDPVRRILYCDMTLEHSRKTQRVQNLRQSICLKPWTCKDGQVFEDQYCCGRFNGSERVRESKELALLLEDIMQVCKYLETVHYTPDDNARDNEVLYLAAWKKGNFKAFTIVISRFRDLSLVPYHKPFESICIEVAHEGDLQWDL